MNELASLLTLSFKTERAASRRLAQRTGLPALQALRQTLILSAGQQGLSVLLAQRSAEQQLVAQRAADRAAAVRRRPAEAPSHTPWQAWFDGSAHPNPGRCAIGALLTGPNGEVVEIARPAGHGNSSQAEYRALIAVLEAALAAQAHGLTVHGDSRVVLDDVAAPEHRAARALLPYRAAALALLAQLPDVTLRWVPRHRNTRADALSQQAIAQYGGNEA